MIGLTLGAALAQHGAAPWQCALVAVGLTVAGDRRVRGAVSGAVAAGVAAVFTLAAVAASRDAAGLLAALLAVACVFRRLRAAPAAAEPALAGLALASTAATAPSWVQAVGAVCWVASIPVALGGPASLALPIAALAALGYVALPRTGDLGPDPSLARVGFVSDGALGGLGELLDDDRVALRLRLEAPVDAALYLRGATLTRWDGERFAAVEAGPLPPAEPPPGAVRVEVEVEGAGEVAVVAPGRLLALRGAEARSVPGGLRVDAAGGRYTAWVAPPFGVDAGRGDAVPDDATEPPSLSASVLTAVRSQRVEGDAAAQMEALAAWLRQGRRYTTAPALTEGAVVGLLAGGEGYCVHFAGALALAGRAVGVPTRVVSGFVVPGPLAPGEAIEVRAHHAHAWAEFHDGTSWRGVDPTPARPAPVTRWWSPWRSRLDAAWSDSMRYDASAQRALARGVLARPSPWAVAVVVGAGLVGGLVRRRRRERARETSASRGGSDPVGRELARALAALERSDGPLPDGTPLAAAAWLEAIDPDRGEALRALVWLAYRVRFGGDPHGTHLAEARRLRERVEAG